MALASQTARSASTRRMSSNMGGLGRFRRRKARVRRRTFTVLLIVALGAFWWLVLRTPESTPKATIAAGDEAAQIEPGAGDQPDPGSMADPTGIATSESVERPRLRPRTGPEGAAMDRPISVIRMGESPELTESAGASFSEAIERARTSSPAQNPAQRPGQDPVERAAPSDAAPAIASMMARAEAASARNRLVESRALYNAALKARDTDERTRGILRSRITEINQTLLFSPTVDAEDPFVGRYEIQSGDALSKLPGKLDLHVNWRFLQRINGIDNPARIRVGQRIKTVSGPFHAVISKSAYRMDVYMGDSAELMYVASFPVGLGENDSTPLGSWVVRKDSKLVNPAWTNPRTGEFFDANDPENPIGERWVGLQGVDDGTRQLAGYGIHGTIEPDSIGSQASMGCVRLGDDDVELIFELLSEGVSRVQIVP